MPRLVFGLGTGRCGTTTLAALLHRPPLVRVSHELRPRLPWEACERRLRRRLESLRSVRADVVGDVAFYYLPYVERILQAAPTARFVCLQRDRAQTIESYLRKTEGRNHWMAHDAQTWRADPEWDPCFPKFPASSKCEALAKYWDAYYDLACEFSRRFEAFRIFSTDDLNNQAALRGLWSFLGLDPQSAVPSAPRNATESLSSRFKFGDPESHSTPGSDKPDRTNDAPDRGSALHCRDVVRLPLARLTSWIDVAHREALLARGLDPFDKRMEETPHFSVLRQIDGPLEELARSAYARYFDAYVALGRTWRNNGEVFHSGLDRLRSFKRLYHRIRASRRFDPIEVAALCDGRFRIRDGQHRAAIALHLGEQEIPARIVEVDEALQALLRALHDDWPPASRTLYQPIEHPIFSDWPVVRSDDRWSSMKDAIDWSGKSVLDVGSYTGFLSRQAFRAGAVVTGIERDERRLQIARQLNVLLDARVSYIHGEFPASVAGKQFDIVLLLSILHWILRDRGLKGVGRCLDRLGGFAPILFLDMAQTTEPKMRSREWNRGVCIDRQTIPDLVLDYSAYTNWRHLGADVRGRDLFMFWNASRSSPPGAPATCAQVE